MKPQFFTITLFATALYWMYLLYLPFLLVITIAVLLAISTANIQKYFEKIFRYKLLAISISSLLLGVLFFAPLGYFLATLTIKLNSLEPEMLHKIQLYIKNFIASPPEYLLFLKPYLAGAIEDVSIKALTTNALMIAGKVGTFSAGFLKNAFLIIIFYFFAQYNGSLIISFLQRIVQISVEESTQLVKELSAVMSVVFYSIIATAMLEGVLFGVAISYMGYNGLLFGIMYGFASLVPVVGGIFIVAIYDIRIFHWKQYKRHIYSALLHSDYLHSGGHVCKAFYNQRHKQESSRRRRHSYERTFDFLRNIGWIDDVWVLGNDFGPRDYRFFLNNFETF